MFLKNNKKMSYRIQNQTKTDVYKLIVDTRIKFCIYARRAFRLQKTDSWKC